MNTHPHWDLTELLDKFGTLRETQREIFGQTGQTVSIKTIFGWRKRNSIPVTFALVLVNLAIKRGLIKDIDSLRISRRVKLPPHRSVWPDL